MDHPKPPPGFELDTPAAPPAGFVLDAPTQATPATPAIARPSGLIRRAVGDTAIDVGKGVIGLGEAVVGAADLVSGGYAGKALESVGYRPADTKAMLSEGYTAERQQANKAVEDASGFVGTAKAMIANPSTILGAVGESAPLMLGGAGIARGMKVGSAIARAAVGEGVVGAGMAAEGIRQQTDDGLLTAKQTGAALASGAGTALIGAAGGAVARRMGIADVDTALAGGATTAIARPGLIKRAAGGAISEGLLEEAPQSAQEQAFQNIALDRPTGEGVAEATAMGALTGGVMGGGFGAIARPNIAPPMTDDQKFKYEADWVLEPDAVQAGLKPRDRAAIAAVAGVTVDEFDKMIPPQQGAAYANYVAQGGRPVKVTHRPLDGIDNDENPAPANPAAQAATMRNDAAVMAANAKTVLGRAAATATAQQADLVEATPDPFDGAAMNAELDASQAAPVIDPIPANRERLAALAAAQGLDPAFLDTVADEYIAGTESLPDDYLAGYVQTLFQDQGATDGPAQDTGPAQERSDVASVGVRSDDVPAAGAVANPVTGAASPVDGEPAEVGQRPAAVAGEPVGASQEGVRPTAGDADPSAVAQAPTVPQTAPKAEQELPLAQAPDVPAAAQPQPEQGLPPQLDLASSGSSADVTPPAAPAVSPQRPLASEPASPALAASDAPSVQEASPLPSAATTAPAGVEGPVSQSSANAPMVGVSQGSVQEGQQGVNGAGEGSGSVERITMSRPESRGGDVEMEAVRVGDTLTIKNGIGYSTVALNAAGTYDVDSGMEVGATPEEAVEKKAARRKLSAQVAADQQRAKAEVAAVGNDPVRAALTKMANGEHPERAMQGLDDATIRAVANAMGRKTSAKQSATAVVERIGEQARGDWMAQARKAANAKPSEPKAPKKPRSQMTSAELKASEAAKKAPTAQPTKAEPVAAPTAGEGETQPAAKIDDFGERLEGARKFLPPGLKEEVGDDQIATMPLSKVWPSEAYMGIEDPMTAAMAFVARDVIPAKPRTAYKVKQWVEKVKMFRGLMQKFTSESMPALIAKAEEQGFHSLVSEFFPRVQLIAQIPRESWKRVEKVGHYPNARRRKTEEELKAEGIVFYAPEGKRWLGDYYRTDPKTGEREELPLMSDADRANLSVHAPFSAVTIDGKTQNFDVPAIGPDEVQKVKEVLGDAAPQQSGLTTKDFEVRSKYGSTTAFINRKGDAAYRKLKEFTGDDAVKQAQAYLKDNVPALAEAWEGVKARDNVGKGDVRRDENRERVGENRRNGKDVTEAMFEQAFGFRGVQFGNWVAQGKDAKGRQGLLNETYDALLDLSDLLGIPSKAISLEGSLGLSLGARGHGKASAHFEPDTLVINLTKTRGAGTLAHEWFHALDNYFARKRVGGQSATYQTGGRENNYITYKPEPMLRSKQGFGTMTRAEVERRHRLHPSTGAYRPENWEPSPNHKEGVRPVVEKAFAELVSALNESPMAKRSADIDGVKVRGGTISSDGYWSRIIERGARSFENYVITKMAQRGWTNDFLANIRDWAQWQATGKNADRYPYLRPEEEGPIVESFDKLFGTIEARETNTGNIVLEDTSHYGERQDTAPSVDSSDELRIIAREFSQADGMADSDRLGLRKAVNAALGGYPPVNVTYLRGEEGLDGIAKPGYVKRLQDQRKSRDSKARTAGLYLRANETVDGKPRVVLFTDVANTPTKAMFTAAHEIAGHHGLRALLGKKLNTTLANAYQNPTVKAVADAIYVSRGIDKNVAKGRITPKEGRLLAIEEALADLAAANRTGRYDEIQSRHGVTVPLTQQKGLKATIARAIEAIKAIFRAKNVRFTDGQVHSLLEASWKAAQGESATMSVMGANGALEQVVFHGTPHTVDKFSLQKIGTGEGAQAYGFGMYFASSKDIAEHYRKTLSADREVSDDDLMDALWEAALAAEMPSFRKDGKILAGRMRTAYTREQFEEAWLEGDLTTDDFYRDVVDAAQRKFNGNLYRVDVPEDADLLDWDKPLSQQPEKVRAAIERLVEPASAAKRGPNIGGSPTGQAIYNYLSNGNPQRASDALMAAGIPGLRYLDGTSRTKGEGSANYVIWDESAIGQPQSALESTDGEQAPQGVVSDGPVRRGDVFRYSATRWATVMEANPGGNLLLRVEGTKNGKPSLTTTEAKTREVKTWPRLGRANYQDGTYLPFNPQPKPLESTEDQTQSVDNPSILESVESVGDSIAGAMNNVRDVKLPAGYLLSDLFGKHEGSALHWWHKSVGTQYNLAKKSPLFKRVFDSVQNMVADVSHYANASMNLAPDILPKFDSFRDTLKKKPMSPQDAKKVSDAVFQGTLKYARDLNGDVVPATELNAGIVWTADELRSRYGMNAKQIGLYQQARAAIDKSLDDTAVSQMIRHAGEDANPVRSQMLAAGNAQAAADILSRHLAEQVKVMEGDGRSASMLETAQQVQQIAQQIDKLQSKGYAPLSRFGRFTVYKDGESPIFLMYETQREANRAARMLKEKHGGAIKQGTMSQEQFKLFKGMTPETLELFGEMLGLDQTGSEKDDLVYQSFLKAAKSNRSALKRLIHRQGIEGYSEDVSRVLASFLYSNARLAATNLHAPETQRAINDIPKEQGDLKDTAIKLNEYIVNPDDAGAFLSSFNFAQYLGGSIASAMVNMTQPLTMSFPWLSQYGGAWNAAKALGEAVKLVGKGGDTGNHLLDEALKRADADGHTQPQEVHQLQALASGKGALRTGDGTKAGDALARAQNAKARLSVLWGVPFSLAEQFNRRSTFIAAWNIAKDQGMADPYGFAVDAVKTTQGIYNKANRPAWSRNAIGGMAFTFKTYSINYVEMLHRMWTKGGPQGKKGVLLAVATMFLLAGAGGLPGADDLDDLIDGIMQRLGYNFSSKQEREAFFANLIGEQGAAFMEHGLSSVPGMPVDVSGRLGMGNLLPSTGLLVRKNDHTRDIAEIAGPTGDLVKRGFESAGQLAEGNVGASVLSLMPRAISNAWKGVEMASTGEYRDTRGRNVLDTTTGEAIAKGIGFQPATVAKVQQASGNAMDLLSNYRIVSADIADRWAKGIHDNDPDAIQSAQEALADWNQKNPDMPIRIGRSALRSRVRNLGMDRRERLSKSTPKAVRSQVETMFDNAAGRRRNPSTEDTE